jgi:hypothetical protein
VIYNGTTRSALYAAGEECKILAATLPRSTWRAVTAFLIITALPAALTVYTAFVQAAPIHVKFAIPQYLLLVSAIFITFITPLMFTRSLWCKRLLFCPALNSQVSPNAPTVSNEAWNIYQFEKQAFHHVGLSSPAEWENRIWVHAIVVEAYILAIFIPIIFTGGAIYVAEMALATFLLSVAIAVVFALAEAGGISALIQLRHQPQTPESGRGSAGPK